jgi:thymidylate kinase
MLGRRATWWRDCPSRDLGGGRYDINGDWLHALTTLAGQRHAQALWLRVPPDLAARRTGQRNTGTHPRLTGEQRAYLRWVDHAYQLLTKRDKQLTVLDIADLDPAQTHQAIHQILNQIDQTGDTAITACASHHESVGPHL